MEGQVPEEIKKKRAQELIDLGNKLETAFVKEIEGTVQAVLFETCDGEYSEGYTQHYVRVRARCAAGSIHNVAIISTEGKLANGEPYQTTGGEK